MVRTIATIFYNDYQTTIGGVLPDRHGRRARRPRHVGAHPAAQLGGRETPGVQAGQKRPQLSAAVV